MAIALEFRDNIQFIVLSGKLTKVEESALRLKLDQKVSQGRNLLIFKLDQFELEDTDTNSSLKELINYFVNIGAWLGLSGLNDLQIKSLQTHFKGRCKGFSTESDAKKWILEESQKPQEKTPPKQSSEDELKRIEIDALIQSYSRNFNEKDDDPFRITKLSQEYISHPSVDFLHAIRSMLAEKDKLEVELQKKEAEIEQTEALLTDYMKVRKLPVTDLEIQSHTKLSETKTTETSKNLSEVQADIESKEKKIESIKQQSDDFQKTWSNKIANLERDLKELKSKHERATEEMKKRDDLEASELEKMKAEKPK